MSKTVVKAKWIKQKSRPYLEGGKGGYEYVTQINGYDIIVYPTHLMFPNEKGYEYTIMKGDNCYDSWIESFILDHFRTSKDAKKAALETLSELDF